MNIVVKDAEGLPDKAYVSIRIGETRRQAPFKVGETFHFPSSQHATMKLDIFQSLGNQVFCSFGVLLLGGRFRVCVCTVQCQRFCGYQARSCA